MYLDSTSRFVSQVPIEFPGEISTLLKRFIADGVTGLQLPVQASRDGALFVCDNECVKTAENKHLFFRYLATKDIEQLSVGLPRFVRLSEYLDAFYLVSQDTHTLQLEIVVNTLADLESLRKDLVTAVQSERLNWEDVVLKSPNQPLLQRAKRHLPSAQRGVMLQGVPWDLADCLLYTRAAEIQMPAMFVDQYLVRDALTHGAQVMVAGVASNNHWPRLKEMGVSGLVQPFVSSDSSLSLNRFIPDLKGRHTGDPVVDCSL